MNTLGFSLLFLLVIITMSHSYIMYVDFSGSSPSLGVRMSKNSTLIYQSKVVGKIYIYTNNVYFPI